MTRHKRRIGNRKKKGDLSLILLVLVALIVIAFVAVGEFIGNYFSFVYKFFNIKGKLSIFMVNDDRGTELLSLLNAKAGNFKHIELLGMYTADGIAEEKSARIEPVKATIDSISKGYDFTFQAKDAFIKYSKGVPTEIQDATKQAILNCPTSFSQIPEDLKNKIQANGGLKWPSDSKEITSGFGGRELDTSPGQCDCHGGIDIAGKDVNVYAAAPGTVVFTGAYGGNGNLIVIGHPATGVVSAGKPEKYDYYTFYGHLSSINVNVGDEISVAGQSGKVIGKSGNSGFTVGKNGGYHVHFEIGTTNRPSDKTAIDPCSFLDLTGVTGLKCDHEQVAACKYVAGVVGGMSVSSYQTDIPLPGPSKSNTNLRGQVIFKQWN
jgi:murein DD-endopeptidase MepM/ murein hydrolase activator NlpD